jgi:integrase
MALPPKTVGYIHAVIHMALNQALKEQLVIRNFAEAVKRPKQSKYEIKPLSIEEIKTFLSMAPEHHFFE